MAKRPKHLPLEAQVETLAACGLTLNPGISIENLTDISPREDYEKDPYKLLVSVMGTPMEKTKDHETLFSNCLFHFDPECIEDTGDYAYILRRMSIVAGETLPLQEIRDNFHILLRFASISFHLNGKKFKWYTLLKGDWADMKILLKTAKLQDKTARSQSSSRKFTYLGFKGFSDCLIGCSTPSEVLKLYDLAGLKFRWLLEKDK